LLKTAIFVKNYNYLSAAGSSAAVEIWLADLLSWAIRGVGLCCNDYR